VAAKRTKPELAQAPLNSRDFRRLIDAQLTEKQFQKQLEAALDALNWWWMHIPSNVIVCRFCHRKNYRGLQKGFPDILAIKPPHIVWIEVKTERGWLDPEQRRVHEMLRACGQRVLHVRPRDREAVLALITHPETA
jgi:hypothetical protein